jgi:hypothetical protein
VILDVRTPAEFATGHLSGGITAWTAAGRQVTTG